MKTISFTIKIFTQIYNESLKNVCLTLVKLALKAIESEFGRCCFVKSAQIDVKVKFYSSQWDGNHVMGFIFNEINKKC